jgi:hypothetical protein
MADTSIDYDSVNIPDTNEKPYHEWSYAERRAQILKIIEQAGHPRAVTKADLARRYDVSPTTIGNDFDALAEWIEENMTRDHEFVLDRVFNGAILNLVRKGEHYKAAKVGRFWYEWLADSGHATRVPKGVNIDATVREAAQETDDYEIITDDDGIEMEMPGEADDA